MCGSPGPQNCNLIKKRLQHRVFSSEICECFKNTLFHRTSLVAASDIFRFPAYNFIKKWCFWQMLFCEFCKSFKSVFLQNTSGWLLFVFICEFWKVFQNSSFIEHLLETAYFMYMLQNFNHQIQKKNYLTDAFQASYTGTRSSHLKAFIYFKSLKIICEEANL